MMGNYEAVQVRAIARTGNDVICICPPRLRSFLFTLGRTKVRKRKEGYITVYESVAYLPLLFKILPFRFLTLSHKIWAYERVFNLVKEKEGRIDIIHGHTLYVSFFSVVIGKKAKIPTVVTEHWSELCTPGVNKELQRLSKAYKKTNAVIAVSSFLADNIHKYVSVPITVIPNMVEDLFFEFSKVNNPDGRFHFITVCRLCEVKNLGMLIEAFGTSGFDDCVVLDIIGDGELRVEIEALIEKKGLSNSVILHGAMKSQDVAKMISLSDCYVVSSFIETFSISLLESMAIGVPVISTKCGGPEDFVVPEVGILVENDDMMALSNAMKEMRENANQAFNRNYIKRYCQDNYSESIVANRILDVYHRVLRHIAN